MSGASTRRRGERAIIRELLAPLATHSAARALTDDTAIWTPPAGRELVMTKDALVADVHFLRADPADAIAEKALAVNLSDLAAKGATPEGYLLAMALPGWVDDPWIERFAAGLAAAQARYGLTLLGGDTVTTPGTLTLSVTALGSVDAGRAITRGGAGPDQAVVVSGRIGDGRVGLEAARGDLTDAPVWRAARDRYWRPVPRLEVGQALRTVATAAADVSDGLVADAGHIAATSGVGMVLEIDSVPLSPSGLAWIKAGRGNLMDLVTAGDDYEIVATVPAEADLAALSRAGGVPLTRIGRTTAEGAGTVTVCDGAGQALAVDTAGYVHDG